MNEYETYHRGRILRWRRVRINRGANKETWRHYHCPTEWQTLKKEFIKNLIRNGIESVRSMSNPSAEVMWRGMIKCCFKCTSHWLTTINKDSNSQDCHSLSLYDAAHQFTSSSADTLIHKSMRVLTRVSKNLIDPWSHIFSSLCCPLFLWNLTITITTRINTWHCWFI